MGVNTSDEEHDDQKHRQPEVVIVPPSISTILPRTVTFICQSGKPTVTSSLTSATFTSLFTLCLLNAVIGN